MEIINTYSRPRPVIELNGTPFYVDAQWLYLFEVGNAHNKIDTGEVRCFKDRLELWYDPAIKNIYQGPNRDSPPDGVQVYWFHSFDALDPVGATARLDELNPQWRLQFPTGVPVIDIAGRQFHIDKKGLCFYEVNNWFNWIPFRDITCRKGKKGLWMNLRIFNVAFPHELNTAQPWLEKPEHIVFVPLIGHKKVKRILQSYFKRNT